MKAKKRFSPSSFFRLIKEKCKHIIHHDKDSSHNLALGASIGTVVAFTPTFGFQMFLVTIVWIIARIFKKKPFNITMSYILTWATNYITVIPYYFIAYFTGILIIKLFSPMSHTLSYEEFSMLWSPIIQGNLIESFQILISVMIKIGIPLFIGSIPYAVILGITAYTLMFKAVENSRKLVDTLSHRDQRPQTLQTVLQEASYPDDPE